MMKLDAKARLQLFTVLMMSAHLLQAARAQEIEAKPIRVSRPPAVQVLKTMEENGGWGKELHRVSISGVATNQDGRPVVNADIYVSRSVNKILSKTKTDEQGMFKFVDLQLPVDRFRPRPKPIPFEGKFCVFGIANSYGFTWAPECRYRPYARPKGLDPDDSDQATTDGSYYLGDKLSVDLTFRPAAKLSGRVSNDFGDPVPNAKVQLGYTDNLNRRSSNGSYRCVFQPENGDHVRFAGIHALPPEYREASTDADGRYSFDYLPSDTVLLALINPGVGYQPSRFRLQTAIKPNDPKRGTTYVGYEGTLDREFAAPRNVLVRVAESTTDMPVSGIALFASAGNEVLRDRVSLTDNRGTASLSLPPGHYVLHVEPKSSWKLLPTKTNLEIAKDGPKSLSKTIHLAPAAMLKLRVVDETDRPVAGVSFEYETDASEKRQPLHSQEVYSDFPQTNAAGELAIYAHPEKRRIYLASDDRYQATHLGQAELLQLEPGKTVTQEFIVKRTIELPTPPALADDPHRIYGKWMKQAQLYQTTQCLIDMRMIRGRLPGVKPQDLQKAMQALPPEDKPDLIALLNELSETEVKAAPVTLAFAGNRRREEMSYQSNDGQTQENSSIVNGRHAIFYSSANSQIDVQDIAASRQGFTRLNDFIPQMMLRTKPAPLPEPQIAGDRIQFMKQAGPNLFSMSADLATGFVYETSRIGKAFVQVDRYFAPLKLPNGVLLPQAHIGWESRNDKVTRLKLHLIDKVVLFQAIPPDTFALSIPAGSIIWDHRGVEAGQRGSHRRANRAVRDVISFLDRR